MVHCKEAKHAIKVVPTIVNLSTIKLIENYNNQVGKLNQTSFVTGSSNFQPRSLKLPISVQFDISNDRTIVIRYLIHDPTLFRDYTIYFLKMNERKLFCRVNNGCIIQMVAPSQKKLVLIKTSNRFHKS